MKRLLMQIGVSFAIAVAAILGIVAWVNSGDPRSELRSDSADATVHQVLAVMIWIGIVGVVFAIVKYATRLMRAVEMKVPDATVVPGSQGFPVSVADGPGQYRVEGVHKQTKMDISKYVQADSAANAKVKAELDDIVVTSVKKTPL